MGCRIKKMRSRDGRPHRSNPGKKMDQHSDNRSAVELRVKTLEFKLTVNATQEQQLDQWLEAQRWAWNRGLGLLKELEAFSAYNKADGESALCCPIPWEYRWQKGDDEEWVAIPYSSIRRYKGGPYSCPIPQPYREPRLSAILREKPLTDAGKARNWKHALSEVMAHSANPVLASSGVPSKITQTTIKKLTGAWEKYIYRKGGGCPRFKPKKGPYALKTLSNENPGKDFSKTGRLITLAGTAKSLGPLNVKTLDKRWIDGSRINTYRITKEPSGWYLLIVGQAPCKPVKPSKLGVGFDAGVVHILNDDAGHHVDIPSPLDRRLKKIKRLSRKAANQKKGSKNQAKTYALLAKEHEKVRRDRKAWHHKLSTFAVRKYDAIAVEDLNLAGMTRRPKAKPNGDGSYAPNMAAAKAGLNRRILDAGIGGLYSMMEAKAKAEGREFVRVPAAYTSQTCNNCGAVSKQSRLTQSEFVCVHCGHEANADTNAAKNIKLKGFPDKYLALAGESKPVEPPIVGAVKQEGASVPPCSDAATIPHNGRDCLDVLADGTLKSLNPVAAKQRKRTSAQSGAQSTAQLSLWGAAGGTTGNPY